ncbi:MAG: hypothetical protein QM493_01015 [Sulfurovum sp.]
MKSYITIIVSSLIFIGCRSGDNTPPATTTVSSIDNKNISNTSTNSTIIVDNNTQVKSLGSASNINSIISIGDTPKSLYIVLSNSANTSFTPIISHSATKMVSKANLKIIDTSLAQHNILPTPSYIREFKAPINTIKPQSKLINIPKQMKKDILGDKKIFSLDEYGSITTKASAKKIVSDITTSTGVRGLNIWVSDDAFDSGSGCSKTNCVTQYMVDILADTFLKDGLENDIYDWVTNIYGSEWDINASNKNHKLIGADNMITILLTDIDKDNSAIGGVIGYAWAKDNYLQSEVFGSNERIIFYVDSVMFANNLNNTWSIDGFWAKETVSTLAHELQHVISFYQKEIMQDVSVDNWLAEMLSEAVEDLVATKVRYTGARGVVYTDGSAGEPDNIRGRYPLFNANSRLSLTKWSYNLADYSKVSAFGTFLIRNYGGAKLLKDIMNSSFGDYRAVEEAVRKTPQGANKTFANLLNEWGVAIILSDSTNLIDLPTYNTGDFTYTTYNNITYNMGSINFFNYSPQPTIYTTVGTINPNSNYFYKVGDNLTGDINITFKLNGETEATVIFK